MPELTLAMPGIMTSLNIVSRLEWQHTVSQSLYDDMSSPHGAISILPFIFPSWASRLRKWPWSPFSLAHRAFREVCWNRSDSDNILFPSEERGKIPGLASERIIVSIPYPSHFFILAAAHGLQQLEDLHNVCSSAPRALLLIHLSCLPHPSALTQSCGTPPHPLPRLTLCWEAHITLKFWIVTSYSII